LTDAHIIKRRSSAHVGTSADQELRPDRPLPGMVSISVIFMQLGTSIRSTFREGLRRLDAPSRNDPLPPILPSGWPTMRPELTWWHFHDSRVYSAKWITADLAMIQIRVYRCSQLEQKTELHGV